MNTCRAAFMVLRGHLRCIRRVLGMDTQGIDSRV